MNNLAKSLHIMSAMLLATKKPSGERIHRNAYKVSIGNPPVKPKKRLGYLALNDHRG